MEFSDETNLRLFNEGGTLIFLDVPIGTEVGIDIDFWNTGEKFKGIKMIPPGIHLIYFSTVGKDGISMSPRIGFFHDFKREELICKRYDKRTEDIVLETCSVEDLKRMKENIKDLDKNLGPYPYKNWKKWISLTSKISSRTVERLAPIGGRICSAPELRLCSEEEKSSNKPGPSKRLTKLEQAEALLPNMVETDESRIRYTKISSRSMSSSGIILPSEISRQHMDWSDKFYSFLEDCGGANELLSELQFAFICFLVGQNFNSFEHWKELIKLICYSFEAIEKHTDIYNDFLTDIYFQLLEVQPDLFTDIVTENNFIYSCLKRLFDNIQEIDASTTASSNLKGKAERFQRFLHGKFGWEFTDNENDEDKPVIVNDDGDY